MKNRQIAIPLITVLSVMFIGQTTPQVSSALDSWSGRSETREAILKVNTNPVPDLIAIASSERQLEIRRFHSIELLATFKTPQSEKALVQLTNDPNPKCRCAALRSITELNPVSALPFLIRRLDDTAVCMKTISTDPAEAQNLYVSDEAVRLLERITGKSFGGQSIDGHSATQPWKEWWEKRGKF